MPPETDAAAVLHLVRRWTRDDVPFWVAGGWGVDALVGRRTRRHADLDVVVAHADGGRVDLHPLTPHPDGGGTQPGLDDATFRYPPDAFATGTVDGVRVPCLSVRQQLAFHQGYDPRPQDVHDLALLRALDGG